MDTILDGKIALVTGATRGIGRATALALAEEGMKLGLVARADEQLAELVERIAGLGSEALPLVCDVSDDAHIESAVDACYSCFGGIDVLVNNAGTFVEAPVEEIRLEDWEYALRVNATAPFLFCQSVLPVMKERGGGHIINISSTSGTKGYPYQAAYCASKHALMGFSRSLSLECRAHGIRVSVLCPGGVRTDFVAGTYLSECLEGQAMLEVENIADLVVFVLRQPGNVDYPEIVVQRNQVD